MEQQQPPPQDYYFVGDDRVVDKLASLQFNSVEWKTWFLQFKKNNHDLVKPMRKVIIQGTIKACEFGYYRTEKGKKIDITPFLQSQQKSKKNYLYYGTQDLNFDDHRHKRFQKTKIFVRNMDSIDLAKELKQKGKNPVVLNMANAKYPGGGYLNGAAAQEEALFRRTNYFQFLDPEHNQKVIDNTIYPFQEFGGVYSSNVLVIRAAEKNGYRFLNQPYPLSFIAVAAYCNPKLDPKNPDRLDPSVEHNTRKKIRTILKIAINHKHDCLVLGAFGCGAFKNPPAHVAEIFKTVIESLNGYLDEIHFAILEDQNSGRKHNPEGNLKPFEDVFHTSYN